MKKLLFLLAFLFIGVGSAKAQQMTSFYTDAPDKRNETAPWESEFKAPDLYESWWQDIAACENLPLPPEHLQTRFYQVNAQVFIPQGLSFWVLAVTYPEFNEIYISDSNIWRKSTVEHEMLHMLIKWNHVPEGDDGHPKDRFDNVCGITITG
jgi:hypothetical protein